MAKKHSKVTRDMIAATKLFDGLMAEKEAKVSAEEIAQIEGEFGMTGTLSVNRRLALAYLSRPFAETAKGIGEDRKTAVALAAVSGALEDSIKKYESIVKLLKMAETRLLLAFCQRPDMQEVIAEGRASLVEDYTSQLPGSVQAH